jgi:membrane protease subunit HflK
VRGGPQRDDASDMPWNDNANSGQKPGPWGSPPPSGGSGGGSDDGGKGGGGKGGGTGGGGGGGDAPRGPRRPNLPPPDFNDLNRRFQAGLESLFGGSGGRGRNQLLIGVAGIVVALWAFSGIYINQPNQEAVVTTFGQYTGITGPGLKYRLPFPFQNEIKVPVTNAQRTVIGGDSAELLQESLMLTGDENIVNLDFTVLWKIGDPAKYLFQLKNPEDTVKSVAESAMREVVGHTALDSILTNGRAKVQGDTRDLIQKVLDSYGSGIQVNEVQISTAGPPTEVVDSFRDVASAKQEADSAANKAGGEAAKIVQGALGYQSQVVQEAQGEAARFNQVYAQYKLAPAVTRQRLYIETMQRVLANSRKVIVDSKGATAPIILPPDAFRPRDSAAAAQAGQTGAGR